MTRTEIATYILDHLKSCNVAIKFASKWELDRMIQSINDDISSAISEGNDNENDILHWYFNHGVFNRLLKMEKDEVEEPVPDSY